MVWLQVETRAGTAPAVGRLFERYGCRILDCADDRLRVGFPGAVSEREALVEARLYLAMCPTPDGTVRLAGV